MISILMRNISRHAKNPYGETKNFSTSTFTQKIKRLRDTIHTTFLSTSTRSVFTHAALAIGIGGATSLLPESWKKRAYAYVQSQSNKLGEKAETFVKALWTKSAKEIRTWIGSLSIPLMIVDGLQTKENTQLPVMPPQTVDESPKPEDPHVQFTKGLSQSIFASKIQPKQAELEEKVRSIIQSFDVSNHKNINNELATAQKICNELKNMITEWRLVICNNRINPSDSTLLSTERTLLFETEKQTHSLGDTINFYQSHLEPIKLYNTLIQEFSAADKAHNEHVSSKQDTKMLQNHLKKLQDAHANAQPHRALMSSDTFIKMLPQQQTDLFQSTQNLIKKLSETLQEHGLREEYETQLKKLHALNDQLNPSIEIFTKKYTETIEDLPTRAKLCTTMAALANETHTQARKVRTHSKYESNATIDEIEKKAYDFEHQVKAISPQKQPEQQASSSYIWQQTAMLSGVAIISIAVTTLFHTYKK